MKFLYRLFFDANDGLDLNYVFFLSLLLLFGYIVVREIPLTSEGWLTFRWILGTLAVMSSPVWLAKILVSMFAPSLSTKSDGSTVPIVEDGRKPADDGVTDTTDVQERNKG